MAKMDVPAETLPVFGATALVATMPVPASPSGGAITAPGWRTPVGSSHLAPRSVRTPAFSPALRTLGSLDLSEPPAFASNAASIRSL